MQGRIDSLLEDPGPANGRQHSPRAGQAAVGRLRHGPVGGEPAARTRQDSRACARSSARNLRVLGSDGELNQSLEKAGRLADFLELAELMCIDALHRNESCGGHYRVESQTPEGEARRDDENFSYVAAWEWTGAGNAPALHKEPLAFEYVHLMQRSYK